MLLSLQEVLNSVKFSLHFYRRKGWILVFFKVYLALTFSEFKPVYDLALCLVKIQTTFVLSV